MKFLFDFFPLIAFFIAFYFPEDRQQGIYAATYTIMVASFIQICLYWLLYKKFEKMHLITFVVVLIFGGLTIYLQDELFIKWKPTIVNWCFAIALISSHFIGDKTLFQRMINMADNKLNLPSHVWININMSWAIFFIFMGFVNLYVAFNYSTEFWVNFKAWGMTLLNLIFIIGMSAYMYRYIKDHEATSQEE
ncbi:MAG: intracellular septation protein [Gammaproteobacteria bacterium]|jgi:intracellular septation protein